MVEGMTSKTFKKKLEELPLVKDSYLTVEGKIDNVIKFAESATHKKKLSSKINTLEQATKEQLIAIINEQNNSIGKYLDILEKIHFKTDTMLWLEGYRKAHQLDTIGEALNHLISVYKAWHIELLEKGIGYKR